MDRSSLPAPELRRARNASILTRTLMAISVPAAGLIAFAGYVYGLPQLFILSAVIMARLAFDFVTLSLIKQNRTSLAMTLVMGFFVVNGLIVPFIAQGLGLIVALTIGLVVFSVVTLAIPPKYTNIGLLFGIIFSILAFGLDILLGAGRVQLPALQRFIPLIFAGLAIPYALLLAREFKRFSLQTKVTLGIMATGGFAVGIISLFASEQTTRLTALLSGRLETNVRLYAEEQLGNRTSEEAVFANQFFEEIAHRVEDLAQYRVALQDGQDALAPGIYWNAQDNLAQLDGGHYGNSAQEPASVFVPAAVPLDDAALLELNTTAYLDFIAPGELAENPSILALYAIDERGIVRYYPNIELAALLPPDFDATQRPYYKITAPLFNPERATRWSIPYEDAAGGGLVVTVAAPLYYKDEFNGVIAADLQLSVITERLSAVTVGQSGFAFMVDDAGRPIYMPQAGYEMLGIVPNELAAEEFDQYTVLGEGSRELQGFTNRMVAGESGLGIIPVNGVETYISFAPVSSSGYSLALVAPVAEMQTAIPATRQETENQLRAASQIALAILAATFLGALLVSIALGRLIASPVQNLTQVANRIAAGDLGARANIISEDETGALAQTFNIMAQTLSETLSGLENRIRERTAEVEQVNKVNAYRASRLETIARISRTVSSTQALETLLPQIAETISMELGFYHTGIFLLDTQKEYAVLAAANSEGGKRMLDRFHRLRVGEVGIVGFATRSGEPRIALDVGQDAVYFNNPDLPETHSEIALPLRVGREIIGALDVQSMETNAFTQEDINILSTLADQVAIAIQNALSYQQSLEALEQARKTAEQLSERQWSQFVRRQPLMGYHFDGVNTLPIQPGQIEAQSKSLAIPIMIRGIRIGTLRLSAPDSERTWNENEIAMAQAAAERAAIAIETARLLDEAQKRAAKERAIGQISARIGSLVNIDNIVQTTLQELGGTLPGTDVAIQFVPTYTGRAPEAGS
jgi:GAF domain-containing protein/HAMP domain-containing protein